MTARCMDLSMVDDAELRRWEPVVQYIRRRLPREDWVDDALQAVRLKLAVGLRDYREDRGTALRTWMIQYAKWGLAEFVRNRERYIRLHPETPTEDAVLARFPAERFEDVALERIDCRRALRPLLAPLTPKERRVVVLMELGGYTSTELAPAERVSPSTIIQWRKAGLHKMRREAAGAY